MEFTKNSIQIQDVERLEKFNGLNYKRWSMKMLYQLTIAKVAYVLEMMFPNYEEAAKEGDGKKEGEKATKAEPLPMQKKWLEDDYICRFMILNAMSNSLFNVFHQFKTAAELWNALQRRYENEDAGNKSFLINKSINFQMTDSRPIIDQINELNEIATLSADVGEPISETFQVATIIGKLPQS
jgi:hypothetical protein